MFKEYNEYIKTTFDNLVTLNLVKSKSPVNGINGVQLYLPRQVGKSTAIAEIAVNYNKAIVVTGIKSRRDNLKYLIRNTTPAISNPRKLINKICRFEPEPKRAFNLNHVFHTARLKDIGNIFRGLDIEQYVILLDELTIHQFMDEISNYQSNNSLTCAVLAGKIPVLSLKSND